MKRQPLCNFVLSGVSITDFGLAIPSPFTSLSLSNSQVHSMTSWTLNVIVGGDEKRKMNIAAFEALLYSAAQSASKYPSAEGIPVSFLLGWIDTSGNISEYISYQGFTLKFKVSTDGLYMRYEIQGFASMSIQSSLPVLRIPAISGFVQPSAIVEELAHAVKATSYYELDIDHNDAPTLVNHGPLTTSFNQYVRGVYTGQDDYDTFPGLLPLSKSWNASRDSAGLVPGFHKLSQIMNNTTISPLGNFLQRSNTDTTPQEAAFTYWVDEPTMTQPGVIHYKSQAGLASTSSQDLLEYGTANTNILSLTGSYDGVAYSISDLKFDQIGFALDSSGNTIAQGYQTVNSWSSSLPSVYQSANIVNDVNALATQFSGEFSITILGSVKAYTLAQPVSLLVLSGNTVSPVTGVYNITSVSHEISNTFITILRLQRLIMSSANQVATSQGILLNSYSRYGENSFVTTRNIISPYKVDLGTLYPTYEHMASYTT